MKKTSDVLSVGQQVTAKIISNKDGKIGLSMKALQEDKAKKEEEKIVIPKAEKISTSLGDLLKDIKL